MKARPTSSSRLFPRQSPTLPWGSCGFSTSTNSFTIFPLALGRLIERSLSHVFSARPAPIQSRCQDSEHSQKLVFPCVCWNNRFYKALQGLALAVQHLSIHTRVRINWFSGTELSFSVSFRICCRENLPDWLFSWYGSQCFFIFILVQSLPFSAPRRSKTSFPIRIRPRSVGEPWKWIAY